MSPTALVEKIASLPAAERRTIETLVDSLTEAADVERTAPREPFDRARKLLEALHTRVDISSSVRRLRDSD